MRLSKRLRAIADMIPVNFPVIDIGCDHALLDIYLTQKESNLCMASDIRETVLENAKKNIVTYHLEDKIQLVKSNGLEAIEPLTSSVLVMAGMGTTTILSILENEKIKRCHYLIIQTNNEWAKLRKEVSKKGFVLDQEKVVLEKGKYYILMRWKKGRKRYGAKQCFLGPLLMKEDNSAYFSYLLKQYCSIHKKIPIYKWQKKISNYKKIKWLQKELKKNFS